MTRPLTYGNGDFSDKQINEKCNFEKFVQINSIMPNEISFDFEIAENEALVDSIFINALDGCICCGICCHAAYWHFCISEISFGENGN